MKWIKLGPGVNIKDDMFPLLLLRDDGKISLWKSPFWFTFVFFVIFRRNHMGHAYTHILPIESTDD